MGQYGTEANFRIINTAQEVFWIDYKNIKDIHDEKTAFVGVSGPLSATSQFPTVGDFQIISGIENRSETHFEMTITLPGEKATLRFVNNWQKWWLDPDKQKVTLRGGTIDATATLLTQGDNFYFTVHIGYAIDTASWMGVVSQKINGTPLCMLPLPGSHDAISYPFMLHQESITQYKTITEQLGAGFRYFDFRVKMKNGAYIGNHGLADTDHYYASPSPSGEPPIFEEIRSFLLAHHGELVILHFSHFRNFGDYQAGGARAFIAEIKKCFGSMLVPREKTPTVTYGDCIHNKQQVVVIIGDSDDDTDKKMYDDWYRIRPAGSIPGEAERRDSLFWMSSECCLQRYSDIKQHSLASFDDDLRANFKETLQDQENHLIQSPNPSHRQRDKFWVSQAVLNYDPIMRGSHNLNYLGAQSANALAAYIYEFCWYKGYAYDWGKHGPNDKQVVSRPNVLLLDYAGYFDGFPEACARMV